MEKSTVGDILRKRIKEQGFNQENFAEKAGISKKALVNYMSGKVAYNYELLEKFSELLECSYDYLLGLSKSPRQEYKEISNQIRLSDDALDVLTEYTKDYDTDINCNMYMRTLDAMIKVGNLIPCMADYMIKDSQINKMYDEINGVVRGLLNESGKSPNIVKNNLYALDGSNVQLIILVSLLKDARAMVGADFAEELKILKAQVAESSLPL